MSLYRRFCREVLDDAGGLRDIVLDYPADFNFGYDVVDAIAAEDPGKRALVWCNAEGEEREFTFADVRAQSNRMANAFREAGLRRGMRVMVALGRRYEYWFALVALHKLGVVAMPVTHLLTVDDYAHRLRAATPDAVVCMPSGGVPARIREAAGAAGWHGISWCVQDDVPGFRNLTAEAVRASDALERQDTAAADPMLLYFTSGTTGYPKGVVHDFSYPLAHIVTARHWQQAEDGGLHFTVAETGWAKASWGKIYGQWLVGSAVMVYDFAAFDPRALCTVIQRYGVTSFCAPPTVYRYLVRRGVPPMPSLRHASTAGEVLDPEVFRAFEELTGVPLCGGYGQTETALLTANFRGFDSAAGSMGMASPLYRLELRGADGRPVPDGQVGEVVVVPPAAGRQAGIFSAYLDDDGLYRRAWDGGVYHTGDAARRDADGRFWFFGRFDDIIKTGGFRVGPHEVENVLMEHPAVAECSVVGVPDRLRGQAIKAFVVLGEGFAPSWETKREILQSCNGKLAEYKWVRLVEFVEEMPKTISGKIRKALLKDPDAQLGAAPNHLAGDTLRG